MNNPVSKRRNLKLVALVSSANFMEMFDFMVFGFYSTWIARTFFPAASEFALRQIRAEALNGAFGLEAGHQALTAGDAQIQAALKLFDRAAALLASRQEQAPKPPATGAPLG